MFFGSYSMNRMFRIYTKYSLQMSRSGCLVDGNSVAMLLGQDDIGFNTNIRLFSGINKYYSFVRMYNFKIYDNDTLVRDFIPVLDDNGIPCMYDKVEDKFYYNMGTGQFIAGPVITE